MIKDLSQFKMPRWNELPPIPLYLDQMLLLLDEWLGAYLSVDGRKIMTKTMINNYVKLKFINPPVNKRYDRLTIANIFVIAILKPVFTMEEITELISLALNFGENPEEAYDQFCNLIESAVDHAFNNTTFKKPDNPDDPRNICWNACNAFASQLYVRYIYLMQVENK